ncbi:ion channel [Vibrio cholerae]|nr:ion channel [Vibrio cholerae]WOQ95530.1 ion channel [Vibrio cholerae]WOQ95541.1 ion channel [Vibrio cholerae]
MPSDLHNLLKRNTVISKKPISLKQGVFDVVFWYGIVVSIYYHFPNELWKNEDYASLAAIGGGYLSFFILTIIGSLVVVYLVESYKLIHNSLIPGSVSLLVKKLGGVFISYLGVALLFSAIYRILNIYIERAFNQNFESSIDSIYFSIVTITTLGYGDILPVHWLSKILVIVEVLMGVMFLAVMIGLIISTSLDHKDQSESNEQSLDKPDC